MFFCGTVVTFENNERGVLCYTNRRVNVTSTRRIARTRQKPNTTTCSTMPSHNFDTAYIPFTMRATFPAHLVAFLNGGTEFTN
jgi:hypothetical protein